MAGKAVTRLGRVIPADLVKHRDGATFKKSTTQLRIEVMLPIGMAATPSAASGWQRRSFYWTGTLARRPGSGRVAAAKGPGRPGLWRCGSKRAQAEQQRLGQDAGIPAVDGVRTVFFDFIFKGWSVAGKRVNRRKKFDDTRVRRPILSNVAANLPRPFPQAGFSRRWPAILKRPEHNWNAAPWCLKDKTPRHPSKIQNGGSV